MCGDLTPQDSGEANSPTGHPPLKFLWPAGQREYIQVPGTLTNDGAATITFKVLLCRMLKSLFSKIALESISSIDVLEPGLQLNYAVGTSWIICTYLLYIFM